MTSKKIELRRYLKLNTQWSNYMTLFIHISTGYDFTKQTYLPVHREVCWSYVKPAKQLQRKLPTVFVQFCSHGKYSVHSSISATYNSVHSSIYATYNCVDSSIYATYNSVHSSVSATYNSVDVYICNIQLCALVCNYNMQLCTLVCIYNIQLCTLVCICNIRLCALVYIYNIRNTLLMITCLRKQWLPNIN